jgi:glucose/arabinose dehydrogenase
MGGKLFVSTGEAADPAEAQDVDSRLGKILRYNPDGSIPDGNPFSEPGDRSPVWSFGHRNPFGLAARPGTNRLYSTENGRDCDDELNRIRPGANYGWGEGYECGTRGVGPDPRGPIHRWSEIVVPTDVTWYSGRLKSLSGSLYAGDFHGNLHRFFMNAKGTRVREDRVIHEASPIVDVAKGPGGWLYFVTTDAIYRIVS